MNNFIIIQSACMHVDFLNRFLKKKIVQLNVSSMQIRTFSLIDTLVIKQLDKKVISHYFLLKWNNDTVNPLLIVCEKGIQGSE